MCGYIDHFTKVTVVFGGLKCWIFEKGLRLDSAFQDKLSHNEDHNIKDLLSKAQSQINYEEKPLVD